MHQSLTVVILGSAGLLDASRLAKLSRQVATLLYCRHASHSDGQPNMTLVLHDYVGVGPVRGGVARPARPRKTIFVDLADPAASGDS